MEVDFIDLNLSKEIQKKILKRLEGVLSGSDFILGKEVELFEQRYAEYCGVKHAVGVNSGTDALSMSLRVAGVEQGDEVITVANSFIATSMAVSHVGAKPVFVDVDEETLNIDSSKVERAITKKTKAILPVHYAGRPFDMKGLSKVARKYKLPVIEDAAQAVGTEYYGKRAGSLGKLGCFSFFPTKTLSCCGDGGIITTDSKQLAEKLRLMRNFGRKDRDTWTSIGINSRLDEMQAAILNVKLDYLDRVIEVRRSVADFYTKHLKDYYMVPIDRDYEFSTYHFYIIKTDKKDNQKIAASLLKKGVDVRIHYPLCIHQQPCYRDLKVKKSNVVVAEKLCKEMVTLPVYENLTKKQLTTVVKELISYKK